VPLLLLVDQVQAQDYAAGEQSPAEPIKAKQRQMTYEVQPDGSEALKYKEEGVFYRSSSGAELNKMGNQVSFIDSSGNFYRIVPSKKLAVLAFRNTEPPHRRSKLTEDEIKKYDIKHEMTNGFYCAVIPAYLNGKPSGKVLRYLPYDLEIRSEVKFEEGRLTVRELYDIEVAEPDPSLMRIPEGYSVADETEHGQ
jgi:hypothetical protein